MMAEHVLPRLEFVTFAALSEGAIYFDPITEIATKTALYEVPVWKCQDALSKCHQFSFFALDEFLILTALQTLNNMLNVDWLSGGQTNIRSNMMLLQPHIITST